MSLDTTSRLLPRSNLSDPDFNVTLCGAYFGFTLSAILFGITVRQAYQYFVYTMERESKIRRTIIGIVCVLDALNLVFGMNLLYCYIRELLGDIEAGRRVVWSLKALATTQVFLILLVHLYYLRQMWIFSSNSILLRKRCRIASQIFVITVGIFAIAVAAIFLSYLPRIDVVYGFSPGLEYILYLAFGTVAVVDCSIASTMCVILYKCSSGIMGITRSESVLESLIQYFIGTGLLTSLSAIMVIILYVARPHTLLYLAIEFSVTRLYANSILAMFNARHTLSDRMSQTIELHMPRDLTSSKEPESSGSRFGWHGQFATSPTSATRYSPGGDSSRYTPVVGSHKQEHSGEEKPKVSHETARYTV